MSVVDLSWQNRRPEEIEKWVKDFGRPHPPTIRKTVESVDSKFISDHADQILLLHPHAILNELSLIVHNLLESRLASQEPHEYLISQQQLKEVLNEIYQIACPVIDKPHYNQLRALQGRRQNRDWSKGRFYSVLKEHSINSDEIEDSALAYTALDYEGLRRHPFYKALTIKFLRHGKFLLVETRDQVRIKSDQKKLKQYDAKRWALVFLIAAAQRQLQFCEYGFSQIVDMLYRENQLLSLKDFKKQLLMYATDFENNENSDLQFYELYKIIVPGESKWNDES